MNPRVLAVIMVAAFLAAGVGGYIMLSPSDPEKGGNPISPPTGTEFGWEYNDCYLDVTDADSLLLQDKPKEKSKDAPKVLGANIEDNYSGTTLYKRIGGEPIEVSMYRLSEDGEREDVEIDRPVKALIELSEDAFVIVYYGKESNANTYVLWDAGYRYDPNCQLVYLVDGTTGKMHNITVFTREIVHFSGHNVDDRHYTLVYTGVDDGSYKFMQDRHHLTIPEDIIDTGGIVDDSPHDEIHETPPSDDQHIFPIDGEIPAEGEGDETPVDETPIYRKEAAEDADLPPARYIWFSINGDTLDIVYGTEEVDWMSYYDPPIYPII